MLAENRFNRFNLSFGIGYDFLRAVTDAYFLFAYPFFLSVPGYNVRAVEPAGRRARPQSRNAALHQRADRRPRPRIPVGPLDARLPVGEQPASELHHRRPQRRKPRPVLPRCARRPAPRLPRDHRRHLPRPRRKRRRRRQLRFLEHRLRRREALRPQGRDRHARQGHRPGHDRPRAGHGHARQSVAEVLGRAHGHAVPPGRYPRPGDPARPATATAALWR